MEIPDLIKQRLGDEELESAVNLGDEDVICFTPSRTLLYYGEGLLSDDSLNVYDHDVDRLDVSEGRRKTSFTLTYVDSEEQFTVASDRTEAVLERLLAGVLKTADVIESEESIEGVFRFSELTLVITDQRIVKHVGSYLWDPDYEEYPYANVTELDFEEGSVATYIVISVDGRPQRIKAPRGDAELVKRALTSALCSYYEVDSIEQLNRMLDEANPAPADDNHSLSSDIELDDSIDPLVTPDDEDDVETLTEDSTEVSLSTASAERVDDGSTAGGAETGPDTETASSGTDHTKTADSSTEHATAEMADSSSERTTDGQAGTETAPSADEANTTPPAETAIDPDDIEAMKSRLATLTKVAKRQNKLLEQQQQTINQLVEELKRQQ